MSSMPIIHIKTKPKTKPDIVVHTCNPRTSEAEAETPGFYWFTWSIPGQLQTRYQRKKLRWIVPEEHEPNSPLIIHRHVHTGTHILAYTCAHTAHMHTGTQAQQEVNTIMEYPTKEEVNIQRNC